MAVQIQKKKLLYLMKILLERTDEQHIMSAKDLIASLEEYGITAERKGIYSDIDTLRDFGLDIIQMKANTQGYYVGSREFSMPELKLLVDAVQSSKFITKKKSDALIRKLETLTSKGEARALHRQVFIRNRIKTENETIYYSVDSIHSAINSNVQIKFQYAEWTVEKKLRLRRNGAFYTVSPWALTWDNENYYLIAFDQNEREIRHYRVDKMRSMELTDAAREGRETFEDFDIASFAKKTFGMFSGRDRQVTLLCHNSLAGVMIDRFGSDITMIPADEEHFRFTVTVTLSRQFFGWMVGIGTKLRLEGPQSVRDEYRRYLTELLDAIEP